VGRAKRDSVDGSTSCGPRRPHALEKSGANDELGTDYSATIRRYQAASLRAAALQLQRTARRELHVQTAIADDSDVRIPPRRAFVHKRQ
jgi:hypothetical protein